MILRQKVQAWWDHHPKAKAWRERHPTIASGDFIMGVLATGAVYAVAIVNASIRKRGITILLVEASIAVALLAVVLTALAILVAFLDRTYVKLLRESVSIPVTIRPYKTIARVSGTTTVIALLSALAWPPLLPGIHALMLAIASGFTTWSVVGTVQIVGITAWHGGMRSRMEEIPESARDELERRKGA